MVSLAKVSATTQAQLHRRRRPARAPPRGVQPAPARRRPRRHHRGRTGGRRRPTKASSAVRVSRTSPTRRRRHDRGRTGPRRTDGRGRPAPRRRGGHGSHPRRHPLDLRRGRGHGRRRGDQARPLPVQLEGGAAGGDHPQDARRHGGGLAGPADQAGRPSPQHAHPGRDARVEAAPHRPGDLRRLRAVGAPPRRAAGALAARGPRLRHAPPEAVRGDRADGGRPRPPSARSTSSASSSTCASASRRWASRRT